MHFRTTSMLTAGIWVMALPAQVPLVAPAPAAPAVRPQTKDALREFIKRYGRLAQPENIRLTQGPQLLAPGQTGVCSIPLLQAKVTKETARMPVLRPRPADEVDHMPFVKLPAPPCGEELR